MVAESDVVITTAAVPGRKAPVLITKEMVAGMASGSVIVDLAAERGGNCELTKPDEAVVVNGVTILGPTNLPASVPYHASQMYAKNVANFAAAAEQAGHEPGFGRRDRAGNAAHARRRSGERPHPRADFARRRAPTRPRPELP